MRHRETLFLSKSRHNLLFFPPTRRGFEIVKRVAICHPWPCRAEFFGGYGLPLGQPFTRGYFKQCFVWSHPRVASAYARFAPFDSRFSVFLRNLP